jgi:hypothetical protein
MIEKSLKVQRHELKYYINRSDYEYAKSMLKNLMKRDFHQVFEDGYFIRSLYFDDFYESSVEEKLAGIEKRDKYRIRIYDFGQKWAKLERKRKLNHYVQKATGIITREEAIEFISGNFESLKNYDNPNTNSIFFDLKRKYFKPVLIVDYIRDAFMLDYNQIRITFDKQIRVSDKDFDLFNEKVITEPIQRDDVIIMEVKFNNFLPSWFGDLIRFESATLSAISKYCLGRMKHTEYYNYYH